MASLADILARQKDVTGQLSTQTRTLALGFLAFAWALLTANADPLKTMAANAGQMLPMVLAAVSVLVLVCDWFQYYFGAEVAKATAAVAENAVRHEATFDQTSLNYRLQWGLYYLKLALLAVGFALLLIIFVHLFRTPAKSSAPSGASPPPSAAVACVPVCCPQPIPPPPAPVCKPKKSGGKHRPCASGPSDKGGRPGS